MVDYEEKETLEMKIAFVQTNQFPPDLSFSGFYKIIEYKGRDLNDSELTAVMIGGDRLMIDGVGVYTKTTDLVSPAFRFPDGEVSFCRKRVNDRARPAAIRHLVYTLV